MVAVTRAPSAVRSTCLMVSMAGKATIAAPCFSMAAMVRSMVSGSMRGRTASWTRTMSEAEVLGEGRERVGNGVLAEVAAGDDVDPVGELVLLDERGDAGLFGLAHGDVDGRDARDGEERLQRMQKDRQAFEGEELLGGGSIGGGHAGADSGGGKDDEDGHGRCSITR